MLRLNLAATVVTGEDGVADMEVYQGLQIEIPCVSEGISQSSRKSVNPNGPDGRPITCKSCGSFRHLVANCPESWENLAEVNITENDEGEKEHVVLFTGYDKEEILRLGTDARNCAVLDSACSSTL